MEQSAVERLAAQFCESLRLGRTAKVWAALKLFNEDNKGLCVGVCLDADCAWVMLHGRSTYEAFLANPDTLADIACIEHEWDTHRGGRDFISAFVDRLKDFGLDENPEYQFEMLDDDQERFRDVAPNPSLFPRLWAAREAYLRLLVFEYSGQPEGGRYESGTVRAVDKNQALAKLADLKIRVDHISQG